MTSKFVLLAMYTGIKHHLLLTRKGRKGPLASTRLDKTAKGKQNQGKARTKSVVFVREIGDSVPAPALLRVKSHTASTKLGGSQRDRHPVHGAECCYQGTL